MSRSSQCYEPKGEGGGDLSLTRCLDKLYTEYSPYRSQQLIRGLWCKGVTAGRHRIRRLTHWMGIDATYRRQRNTAASPKHWIFAYLLRGLMITRADHV